MHRHGHQGRKLSRERDQRKALIVGLAVNLIDHKKIETTLPKAKELIRFIEKLITRAKKQDLASQRIVMARLPINSARILINEIAPKLTGRSSGHIRIVKTRLRVGDGAQMAVVEFVDDLSETKKAPVKAEAKPAVKQEAKVESVKKEDK